LRLIASTLHVRIVVAAPSHLVCGQHASPDVCNQVQILAKNFGISVFTEIIKKISSVRLLQTINRTLLKNLFWEDNIMKKLTNGLLFLDLPRSPAIGSSPVARPPRDI